jgi:membrane protein YdbS with pleckstrin-like domain
MLITSIAWIPYVISLLVSRSLLASRNPKATAAFIVAAIVITIASVIVYLNLFDLRMPLSPILAAVAVTIVLVVAALGISATCPAESTE